MKKAMMILLAMILSSCDNAVGRSFSNAFAASKIIYQASTRFMYSTDGGTQWLETIQEIPVEATYYMAVEMKVSQSEETKEEKMIVARIAIPNTAILDCYLDDHPGVKIEGKRENDESIVYEFPIVAGTSPHVFRVIFDCKPLSEGRANIEVVYDDSVSDSWDATAVIKYVATE